MAIIQRNLHDHLVVAGYGTSGNQAVDELIARGTDASCIVVMAAVAAATERDASLGCALMTADATWHKTLTAERLDSARPQSAPPRSDATSPVLPLPAPPP